MKIRSRPITADDLAGIADLLARGFPRRSRAYWVAGLEHLARRSVPDGLPRFGFMLESDGRPVGAILMIAQTITHAGAAFVRCNLASWYVEPAFRGGAAMLSMMPLRYKAATYLNISAAPNTWATIEAQGFRRYTAGQRLALPILARQDPALRVAPFDPLADAGMPEAGLLADHAATGCLALVGHGAGEAAPFVLLPFRARGGRLKLPAMQVVYCRSIADIARFGHAIGRVLARRATPFLLFDAVEGEACLPGVFLKDRARKYVRGAQEPRLGDLAYTEFTIFGP